MPGTGQQPPPDPIPAATVVVVRNVVRSVVRSAGIEVLLLRRNPELAFAGGHWVFPGGRVDAEDHARARVTLSASASDAAGASGEAGASGAAGASDGERLLEAAARHAAVREAEEEAGITLDPSDLVWLSHWTPPALSIKRFATWFFVTGEPEGSGPVTIDGGEIHDHAWLTPDRALADANAGRIELSPPTWITLDHLGRFEWVEHLLVDARSRPAEFFTTKIAATAGALVALYDRDAGYCTADPDLPGDRHRLWMEPTGWRYERNGRPDADRLS